MTPNNTSNNFPKISIITPSFNQGAFIEATIKSVLSQNYPNFELIIIDGGSTDNTIEVLKQYDNSIDYWVSEKDSGQSNAINKGFKIANGDIVTWLNSDDLLLPDTLFHVATMSVKHPDCKWFAGNIIWIDEQGTILKSRKGEQWCKYLLKTNFLQMYGPSSFFKKSLLTELGYLREDFHYTMDTELWWRFAQNGISFKRLNNYCWAFRHHANAKTTGQFFEASTLASSGHHSHKATDEENKIIENLYFYPSAYPLLAKCIQFMYRLTSFRYLVGRIESILLNSRNISSFRN